MVAIICADVLTRNVAVPGLPRGIAWSNEVSELLLYAITLLAAPWLLREGQHIRVDIVLRALPQARRLRLRMDRRRARPRLLPAGSSSTARSAALKSWQSDALSIKTLVMPEWWFLAPLPICFVLLAIEFVFRMRRLARAEVGPRDDAVSAA